MVRACFLSDTLWKGGAYPGRKYIEAAEPLAGHALQAGFISGSRLLPVSLQPVSPLAGMKDEKITMYGDFPLDTE